MHVSAVLQKFAEAMQAPGAASAADTVKSEAGALRLRGAARQERASTLQRSWCAPTL